MTPGFSPNRRQNLRYSPPMRISLRTLLVLLTVAPPLGWIGYLHFAEQQVWRHRLEGPWIRRANFVGNAAFSDKKLLKVSGVNESIRLNAYTAAESVRKIETFYAEAGFPRAKVRLLKGGKSGDKLLAFQIVEGERKSP